MIATIVKLLPLNAASPLVITRSIGLTGVKGAAGTCLDLLFATVKKKTPHFSGRGYYYLAYDTDRVSLITVTLI